MSQTPLWLKQFIRVVLVFAETSKIWVFFRSQTHFMGTELTESYLDKEWITEWFELHLVPSTPTWTRPSPSVATTTHHIGLQTAAFIFSTFPQYFKTHQWTRHISFYSLLICCMVGPLQHVISSPEDIPKFLPSDQPMMKSKIPGPLGFSIQGHCIINTICLLQVLSVTRCVEGTFLLIIQFSI